jgi:molybdate/tungstate transport system ATP-binding protein
MIELVNVTIRAGHFSLHEISFKVQTGHYGVLMGRTGCGKTTLLETIAGLKPVASGRIILSGCDITHAVPAQRGLGYVPQDGALFSTMSVREHLSFALRIRREQPETIRKRVVEMAQMLDIEPLLERIPLGLSGGERQRVALGRALSFRPRILLLDEPLSAVDEDTREEMYELLGRVQAETRITALHVTHNSAEAQRLGHSLFVIRDGKVIHEQS